jgi:hypothetical protein
VPFKLGFLQGYLVNHPDVVQQALESEAWPPLTRGRMDAIKYWYAGGLATKTGPVHHRLRDRMWIPNLADPAILTRGIEEATRWGDQWRDGGTIEAYEDLRRLALCGSRLARRRRFRRPLGLFARGMGCR